MGAHTHGVAADARHRRGMQLERPVSVLVVDDHPAVRAGLRALIDAEPGLLTADTVADAFATAPAVHAHRPDVVVLDYQLAGTDGLTLCREITATSVPPAVLVYSAFAGEHMVIPGLIAGAAAILDKATEPRELTRTIRRVAGGERLLRRPRPETIEAAGYRVGVEDRALLRLLLDHADPTEIGLIAGLDPGEVHRRTDAIFRRLVILEQAI